MTSTAPPPSSTPTPGSPPPPPDRRSAWLSWTAALLVAIGALFGAIGATVVAVPQVIAAVRPVPAPPTLTFASPSGRLVPAAGLVIRGTSTGLGSTDVLWVATTEIGDNTYHPQTRPCQIAPSPDGAWTCPETYIGAAGDHGRSFYIIIYRVDGQAVDAFLEYDRTKSTETYPGMRQLPRGAEEVQRIEVVRQ